LGKKKGGKDSINAENTLLIIPRREGVKGETILDLRSVVPCVLRGKTFRKEGEKGEGSPEATRISLNTTEKS